MVKLNILEKYYLYKYKQNFSLLNHQILFEEDVLTKTATDSSTYVN